MNKKFFISFLIFLLLFYGCSEKPISEKQKAINAYKEKQNRKYTRNFKENFICVADDTKRDTFQKSITVSPNGRNITYIGHEVLPNNNVFVRVNGERHKSFYGIDSRFVVFSPDSQHIAYVITKKVEGKEKINIILDNNKIGEDYDGLMKPPFFSPDSKQLAYAAINKDGTFVILNGIKKYPFFDGILGKTLKFTSDSQHLIYGTGFESKNKYFITIDGIPQKAYSGIGDVVVANNRIAYLVGDKKDNKAQMVVVDGIEHERYDFIVERELVFSQNGKYLAYAVQKDNKQFLVVNGVEQKKYDGISTFLFSPNGKRLAYVASQGEDAFVILDGKEFKHYSNKSFVDKYGRSMSSLLGKTFVFSSDSQRFAYGVSDKSSQFMALDEVEQKRYKRVSQDIAFSPDNQRFGYIAVNYDDRLLAVVDGKEYPISEGGAAKFCFSPDSKHFAYIISDENRWSVVVDGEAGKYYPNLLLDERKTLFNEDGSFHYLIMRDKGIYLVEEELIPNVHPRGGRKKG